MYHNAIQSTNIFLVLVLFFLCSKGRVYVSSDKEELKTGRDVKGSGHNIFKVTFRNCIEGLHKISAKPVRIGRC